MTTKTFIRDRDCKDSKKKKKDISQDSLNLSLTENGVDYERPSEYNHWELRKHSYISYKINNQSNTLYIQELHSSIETKIFEFPIEDTPYELQTSVYRSYQ